MIKIYSAGGSGENGRNCYAVEWSDGAILLDCGVKREINDGKIGDYPILPKELIAKLKFVLLSHAHEDHSAALPLIYNLGYRGKVYASEPTAKSVPGFINKWKNFVKDNNGSTPFSDEDVAKVEFGTLNLGLNTIEGIEVFVGRSGHVVGSTWFEVHVEGKKVFYSGDIVVESMLLQNDMPSKCDVAVLNCAYAGKVLKQHNQYDLLFKSIEETLSVGGKVILPLPPNGRGCDIYEFLSKKINNAPLYVDKEIIENYKKLSSMTDWVKEIDYKTDFDNLTIISTMEDRDEVCKKDEPALILTQDGMLTAAQGKYYFENLKMDSKNKVIITGHAAKGTIGAGIFDEDFCKDNSINLQKEKIVFKVHLDDEDVVVYNNHLQAETIVLFHSPKANTANAIANLAKTGANAMCILPGEGYEV